MIDQFENKYEQIKNNKAEMKLLHDEMFKIVTMPEYQNFTRQDSEKFYKIINEIRAELLGVKL